MTRILSTGLLLLALAGIAWTFPGCGDDGPVPVDTSPSRPDAPTIPVDTTASLPDAPPLDSAPDAS
jgi:hypothetical protein